MEWEIITSEFVAYLGKLEDGMMVRWTTEKRQKLLIPVVVVVVVVVVGFFWLGNILTIQPGLWVS
jgi:hypothetical protein